MLVNRRLGSSVVEVYFGFRLSVVSARGSSSVAVHFLSSDWCRPSPPSDIMRKKQPNSLTIIISNLRARAGWMTPDTADRVDGHETAGSRHV